MAVKAFEYVFYLAYWILVNFFPKILTPRFTATITILLFPVVNIFEVEHLLLARYGIDSLPIKQIKIEILLIWAFATFFSWRYFSINERLERVGKSFHSIHRRRHAVYVLIIFSYILLTVFSFIKEL